MFIVNIILQKKHFKTSLERYFVQLLQKREFNGENSNDFFVENVIDCIKKKLLIVLICLTGIIDKVRDELIKNLILLILI